MHEGEISIAMVKYLNFKAAYAHAIPPKCGPLDYFWENVIFLRN